MLMENLISHYWSMHGRGLPPHNISYLEGIKNYYKFKPLVIYDIGAAVLEWTKAAKSIWPDAELIAFEAVREVEGFYNQYDPNMKYDLNVLGNSDSKEIVFYQNLYSIGGNSYYKENEYYSPAAASLYDKDHEIKRNLRTLDSVVKEKGFPPPQMLKIDVQGCELDVLEGATETLKSVEHMVIELQCVQYNLGAKLLEESIPFIESLGFKILPTSNICPGQEGFCYANNGPDGDYHFMKTT